jgi:hypothetical protein
MEKQDQKSNHETHSQSGKAAVEFIDDSQDVRVLTALGCGRQI